MTLKTHWPEMFVMLACVATVPLALSAPQTSPSSAVLGLLPIAILAAAIARVPTLRRWGQHGAALLFSFLLVSAARCLVPLPLGGGAMYEYYISPVVIILLILAPLAANTGTRVVSKDHVMIAVSITGVLVFASALLAYLLLSRYYVLEPQMLRKTTQNILLIGAGVLLFKALTRNNASTPVLVATGTSVAIVIWNLGAGVTGL